MKWKNVKWFPDNSRVGGYSYFQTTKLFHWMIYLFLFLEGMKEIVYFDLWLPLSKMCLKLAKTEKILFFQANQPKENNIIKTVCLALKLLSRIFKKTSFPLIIKQWKLTIIMYRFVVITGYLQGLVSLIAEILIDWD